jgi:alkylation response protein AidB-like acyl-CoA dehydrogenase
MDFNHTDDRQMLADMLGRYLRHNYPIEERHSFDSSQAGWSETQWHELANLGVTGALFGSEAGGFGGGGFDIAVVFEQVGRALVVEPLLGTLMGGRVLERTGVSPDLLADAIAGTRRLAFAHDEPSGRGNDAAITTKAVSEGEGWRLSGVKAVVPQVEAAHELLVSARVGEGDDEVGLFQVARGAPGVRIEGYRLIDGGRGGDVVLSSAPAMLVAENALPLIRDAEAAGIVALSWEAVGMLEVLRDTTLDYLRTRRQFGVAIGQFQALQHRMVTVALEIEQARSAAINAAAALEGEPRDRDRAASAAKYTIGRVGRLAAEEAIQMHGGIGMTWELPLSHYAKRLVMIDHQLGDEDHHLSRYAALGRAA